MGALRVWWRGWQQVQQRGYVYIWASLCAFGLSLLVVTAPAAWAGLVRMSYAGFTNPNADIRDFWDGFREHLGRGVVLALLNALILYINFVNLLSYANQNDVIYIPIRIIWIGVIVVWLMIQFYAFPIYYEMERPAYRGAFRNAAVMLLLNPGFTLVIAIGVGVLAALSTALVALWALLTPGLLAAVASAAVLDRLGKLHVQTADS
jgi:uncharacterized membrane protein YesL